MERDLYGWAREAAAALDLPEQAAWASDPAAVRAILDLARITAHGVTRPAAPVGSFLAGVAVGLAGAGDPGLLEAARDRVAATVPAPEG